jgi:hypothetical protein
MWTIDWQRGSAISRMTFRPVTNWNGSETDIFDFELGDCFGGERQDNRRDDLYLDSVIGKQVIQDTVCYTIKTRVWNRYYNQTSIFGTSSMCITNTVLLYDTFLMPEEYHPGPYTCLYYLPMDTALCSTRASWKLIKDAGTGTYLRGLIYPSRETYQKGKGMISSSYSGGDFSFSRHNLLFYRKQGDTCGSFQYPMAISELKTTADVALYPVPAGEKLFLKGPLQFPVQVSLMNTQQQKIESQTLHHLDQGIDIHTLPDGFYLLLWSDRSGNRGNLKAIISK